MKILFASALLTTAISANVPVDQAVFEIPEQQGSFEISSGCAYRPAGDLGNFQPFQGNLTLGFRFSSLEIRCYIVSKQQVRPVRLLLAAPWLDRIELRTENSAQAMLAGELVEPGRRSSQTRIPAFPLVLRRGINTLALYVDSPGSRMVLPLELSDEAAFDATDSREGWLLGAFFGFIACLAVVSVVFGGFSRDAIFFVYALGLVANLGLIFIQFGLPAVIFGYAGSLLNTLTVMLTGVAAVLFTEFHRQYLRITEGNGVFVLRGVCLAGIAVSLLPFLLPFPPAVQVSLYFVILVDLLLLYFLILQLSRRKFRYSAYYLAGWVIFLSSVLLHLLTIFGVLPAHSLMRSAFHLGFLFQSLLFTLALGSKHRELLEEEKTARIAIKLIEQEYRQASDIHRRLLPEKKAEIPGLDLDILYIPMGQLGGDFYTFQAQGDGTWIFLIADVQGHGLPAALDASSVKLAFQEAVSKNSEPGSILSEMNRLLALHLRNRFISAQVLRWLPTDRKMQIASAGHPYPLLYTREAQKSRELRAEGSILGLYSEANYREFEVQLTPGDYLLAYTDGLIEDPASESSYDEDMHNLMAVMESMETHQPTAAHFADHMPRFRVSKPWSDDVTALLLTCK
ncbi:MAG: SpoIIE family protein phosphatase [Spirochaetota bacterium]